MAIEPGGGAAPRRYSPSPLFDSAAGRGLAAYRFLAFVYAGVLVVGHRDHVVLWWPIIAYGIVVLTWSVIAPLRPRPTTLAVGIELLIACVGIFLTSEVYDPASVADGISTVPGVWAASPVIAGALLAGMRGGVLAALVVSVANIIQAVEPSQLTYHNIVLLLLVGALIGLAVQLARESQQRLEQAVAASERLAERERIGRQVHDGVLQALALIHRRGRAMGGEGVDIAELAADQERSLRTMISRLDPVPPRAGAATARAECADLAVTLSRMRSARVEVVLPAGEVRLPTATAREVEAAVVAALDNVEQHAGGDARAWVLLDADDERIEVVVRDNGTGIAPERLVEAAAQGRLGASSSIRGRMVDLGGDASWRSPVAGGTTVTLTLPAEHMAGSGP
ncbi:MacS family sensor histidine kinase [Janibacter cremeus]|uniref:Signal transduction histidine kinase n=1 Tax=Janibacter cremeus TaxID=1285192 RepID=A0A852VLK5_9MICO|nr:DUF5931 domain-containing protein [Janibacter cremeus]NYF96809.1 signal transduction histidine kinase [Janibacter cremeus]